MLIDIQTKKSIIKLIKDEMEKRDERMFKELDKLFQRILKIEETQKVIEMAYKTKKWQR